MRRDDFSCLAPRKIITTEFMNFACDFFQRETVILNNARGYLFLGHDFLDGILKGKCPSIDEYRPELRSSDPGSTIECCNRIHFPLLRGDMWYNVMIDLGLETIWIFDPSFQENESEKKHDIDKVLNFFEKTLVRHKNMFAVGVTKFVIAKKFTTLVRSGVVDGRFDK